MIKFQDYIELYMDGVLQATIEEGKRTIDKILEKKKRIEIYQVNSIDEMLSNIRKYIDETVKDEI